MTKPVKAKYHKFYIINIKLRDRYTKEDLSVEAYEKLFRRLWRKKVHRKSSNQKHCIIKSCREQKNERTGRVEYFSGLLAQFTYIGNESWFNLDKLDVEEGFHLPDYLFPDLVLTDFVFIPSAHRFCYLTNYKVNLQPYPIKNFLNSALTSVLEANEVIQVDVETSHDGIRQILDAKEVLRLSMSVNYSNFDTGDDVKKFFEDNLRASNTNSIDITARAKKGNSIEIKSSPILSGALETARSNGDAEARIVDSNGFERTVNTEDYPRTENVFGVPLNFPSLVYERVMRIFDRKQ